MKTSECYEYNSRKMEVQIREILREVASYTLFIALTALVAYGNFDTSHMITTSSLGKVLRDSAYSVPYYAVIDIKKVSCATQINTMLL